MSTCKRWMLSRSALSFLSSVASSRFRAKANMMVSGTALCESVNRDGSTVLVKRRRPGNLRAGLRTPAMELTLNQ